MSSRILISFITLLFLFIILGSCNDDDGVTYSPKPRGYPRIFFPEKKYRSFDTTCPFKFEIPVYSCINPDKNSINDKCWYNVDLPQFRATLHMSYKALLHDSDLVRNLENSHYFANKHQVKATGLDETIIVRDSAKVYGLLFDIAGNTASSIQFYLTDSSKHFLRGALYFNVVPNIDSLKVVIDYLRKDVLHLINTTEWKKNSNKSAM